MFSDILNANTQLLVTSALYFKGQWLKSFDKHATRMQCFHIPAYGCQDVPMMENIDKYRHGYIAALDSNVVEIPYSVKFDSYVIDKLLHESNSVELNYSTSVNSVVKFKIINEISVLFILLSQKFSLINKYR